MNDKFTRVGNRPTGAELADYLHSSGIQWHARATWLWGSENVIKHVTDITESWKVVRVFSAEPNHTLFTIEYWEHDNGYRATFKQITVQEFRLLKAIYDD